jgi:hypothetical protein
MNKRHHYLGLSLIFIAAIVTHITSLGATWGEDEVLFLKLVPPLNTNEIFTYFDPNWGWFYRPLFLVYFASLRAIFGDLPAAFIAANLVLHGVAAILVTQLALRLGIARAYLTGIIFVALTLSNQAVEWISCASILFVLICSITAIISWLSYIETGKSKFYWLAFAISILAYGFKEEAICLPFLLLSLDLWKRKSTVKEHLLRWSPFVIFATMYLVISLSAHSTTVIFKTEIEPNPIAIPVLLLNSFGKAFTTHPLIILLSLPVFTVLWLRNNQTKILGLWVLICCLPIPLTVGSYGQDSRFWYLSTALAAIMVIASLPLSEGIRPLWEQLSDGWKNCCLAYVSMLCVPLVWNVVELFDDYIFRIVALSIMMFISLGAWRIGKISKTMLIVICVCTIAYQVDSSIELAIYMWPPIVSLIAIVGLGIFTHKSQDWYWWQGLATATCLLYAPVTALLTLLILLLWQPRLPSLASFRVNKEPYLLTD